MTPYKNKRTMLTIGHYYTCPCCGEAFDPKDAEIDYPDIYLECECGYELSDDFYNDIMELHIAKQNDIAEAQNEH